MSVRHKNEVQEKRPSWRSQVNPLRLLVLFAVALGIVERVAPDASAATLGIVKSAFNKRLEELGITSGGVYSPGNFAAGGDSTFDSITLDEANGDVGILRTGAGRMELFAVAGVDVDATLLGGGNGKLAVREIQNEGGNNLLARVTNDLTTFVGSGGGGGFISFGRNVGGSTSQALIYDGGLRVASDAALLWSTSATHPATANQDTGLSRPSAGVVSADTTAIGDGLGLILAGSLVEANTAVAASPNVISGEYGTVFTNEGATAENVHNLPTAVAGARYVFIVQDADGIKINAATGDTIRVHDRVSATGGYASSNVIGAAIILQAINATEWVAETASDNWGVDGGTPAGAAAHGEYYWSTPSATTLSAATPAKAAGSTTSLKAVDFTHADNKLTYDGAVTKDFMVTVTISMTKASGGSTLGHLHIAKNGTEVTGLEVRRTLANTSDEGAVALVGTLELASTDYVEVFVETDNGDDLTVQTGVVTVEVAQ